MKKIKSMSIYGNFKTDSYPELIQSSLQSGEKRTWCLYEGPEELSNTSLF